MRRLDKAHIALHRTQCRQLPVAHRPGRRIEHCKKVTQCGRLKEQPGDKTGQLLEPADHHHRETHEADDSADTDLAALIERSAQCKDGDDGQCAGGAVGHRQPRPAAQHRVLRRQHPPHQIFNLGDLGCNACETLHHQHVAQHITGAFRDGMVQLLDLALGAVSAAYGQGVEDGEAGHQRDHQQRELPVHAPGQRHHDHDGQCSRQVLTKKA